MLGFTSISEAPIAEATTTIRALGYLSTTLMSASTGTLAYEALAHVTPSPATASFIANDFADVDAQALINLLSAPATFSINDFADVDAQATTTPTAVTASFTVNDFYDVDAKANVTLAYNTVESAISGVDFDAKANITTGSISISGSVEEPAYIWGSAKAHPVSAFSRFFLNLDAPDAVTFDYEQFADKYDRTRTVVILGYISVGTPTLYIVEENNTVVINAEAQASRTVVVPEENYTVIIPALSSSSRTIQI